ncbi:MAG TPA: hypothetical protein VIK41_28680 [Gemmatimonadaceae bacterium]
MDLAVSWRAEMSGQTSDPQHRSDRFQYTPNVSAQRAGFFW